MVWTKLAQLPNGKAFSNDTDDLLAWEIRDDAVWFQGREKLRRADPDSFEFLDDDHTFLARDANHVFHASSKVTSVDRLTFEALGDRYYRDKDAVYFEYETSLKPLKGRDAEHFAVLGDGFARDSIHGYYWGTPLRKCDAPLTLEVVANSDGYAKDNAHVYFESAVLNSADVGTWELLPCGFSRDQKNVYHGAEKLPRARADSWQHLKRAYSRDDKTVYCMQFPLKGCDPATFEILDGSYSTDGTRVYHVATLLEEADASSFQVDKNGQATDRHGAFDRGGNRAR